MRASGLFLFVGMLVLAQAHAARADFSVTNAIVEFTADKPKQQDIEVVSRSKETQYIVSEVYEIKNPGSAGESRELAGDPSQSGLLVTPDKMVLADGDRKTLRFVLLGEPGKAERVYRVVVKPVVKGIDSKAQVGVKVLVGYEVLVIVRPAVITSAFKAARQGKVMTVTNSGNTDILFQTGSQCPAGASPTADSCVKPPVIRVYPGQTATSTLALDAPVTYSIWDGVTATEKRYD